MEPCRPERASASSFPLQFLPPPSGFISVTTATYLLTFLSIEKRERREYVPMEIHSHWPKRVSTQQGRERLI